MLVVKIGGRTFEEPEGRARLLGEIAAARAGGLVVVHGGGSRVTAELAASGVAARFVGGLRVTDEATMAVVERVLTLAGKEIAHGFLERGARALALTGRDLGWLVADERPELGRVGSVRLVDGARLRMLAEMEMVPVLAPIALGHHGGVLNVNADEVAGAVAGAVRADTLLLLTDVDQVIGPRGPAASLTVPEALALVHEGHAKDGMQPKLEAAMSAAVRGVKVVIANGNRPGVVADALAGRIGTKVTT